MMSEDGKRKEYLDALRILASFAVMLIHISSQYKHSVSVSGYEGIVFRSYLLLSNWAVPVFCMISGCLFLSRDIPIAVIFKKYVARIAFIFVCWSFIYAVVFESSNGIGTFLASFVKGYSHLWFLYMIAGLYIVTPILRKAAEDETILRYFIVLGVVTAVLIPEIIQCISLISGKSGKYLSGAFGSAGFQTVSGYAIYFMLGYYLDRTEKRKLLSIPLLISCLVLAYLIPVCINVFYSVRFGKEPGFLFSNYSVGELIRSCAIFMLAKAVFDKADEREHRMIRLMAGYSLGAYLIHQMVITLLNRLASLNTLSCDALISIPLIGAITFVISYVLAFIIGKIPFVKKTIGL